MLFAGSSELLSPIFNRPEKQEEVTRTMSLSERLRQEFGLDDSTDDEEHKTGNCYILLLNRASDQSLIKTLLSILLVHGIHYFKRPE